MKDSIDEIARELRISQSAVWKILISHYLSEISTEGARQALERVTVHSLQQRQRSGNRVSVR